MRYFSCVASRHKKRVFRKNLKTLVVYGAGGRNRTDMELPPRDFESRASTSFTTPAKWRCSPERRHRTNTIEALPSPVKL